MAALRAMMVTLLILSTVPLACGESPADKASAFLKAGMTDEAISILQVEIERKPANVGLHMVMGRALVADDDLAAAKVSFERAARLSPGSSESIGRIYFELATEKMEKDDTEWFALFTLSLKYNSELRSEVETAVRAYAKKSGEARNWEALKLAYDYAEPLLTPETRPIWGQMLYELLKAEQPKTDGLIALATVVSRYSNEIRSKIARLFVEGARVNGLGSKRAGQLLTLVIPIDSSVGKEAAAEVWQMLERGLADLPKLGQGKFYRLRKLATKLGLPDGVRKGDAWRLVGAIVTYDGKDPAPAISKLTAISKSAKGTPIGDTAQRMLAPPSPGIKEFSDSESKKQCRQNGSFCVQIVKVEIFKDSIRLFMRFTPKSERGRVITSYNTFDYVSGFMSHPQPYLLDDNGNTFHRISELTGAFEDDFRHIGNKRTLTSKEFRGKKGEVLVSSVDFPMISLGARKISYNNPNNNGYAWGTGLVTIKGGPFDRE